MTLIYTTLLNDVAKPTIILLIMVLFLALTLYISYIYYTRVNKPLYLSKINYDAYENQSFANQPLISTSKGTPSTSVNKSNQNNSSNSSGGRNIVKPTTSSGKRVDPKIDINELHKFANLQSCPQGQCAIKITGNLIGVKRCPSTKDGIMMYDVTEEQCVQSNLCPTNIPYAQKINGEALNGVCETESDGCNCLVVPQCASYVTKYFNNVGIGNYGEGSHGLNYAFSTEGQKPGNNFYNPLQISIEKLGKVFCKINPAFVDTIINGCPLTNHWTDPTNCEVFENVIFNKNTTIKVTVQKPSSVYTYFNSSKDISDSEYYKNANSLAVIVSGLIVEPPETLPFVGFFFDSRDKANVFRYTGYDKAVISIALGTNFYILKNVNYYDNTDKLFKPGVNGLVSVNDKLTFNYFDFTFCNDGAVNGANNKSMLMCVQDRNQPCTEGTLAYNFDRAITKSNNSRNFCQAYDQPGVDRLAINTDAQASIKTFYLTDPAFFTQSCVLGSGCGENIDFTLCDPDTSNCDKAITNKKSRCFPIFDDSAVSNVWQIGPEYVQLNALGPSIVPSGTQFYLQNNLFDVEDGDYYQINNRPINDLFLMKKVAVGDNNFILNTTAGLTTGDKLLNPLIDGSAVSITEVSGNSITISSAVTAATVNLFKAGTHLLFNNPLSPVEYGLVKNVVSARKKFSLLGLEAPYNNQSVTQDQIRSQGIIFYKQFGFNGLNYGTCYNIDTFEREFSDSHKYGKINNYINPTMRLAIVPPFIVDNLISNYSNGIATPAEFHNQVFSSSTANFKQKNSMYFPVWNEDMFRQECVFCSPSLYAIPGVTIDGGKISAVDIQFSGKDFYQYTKDIGGKIYQADGGTFGSGSPIEYYMYTMYSLTSTKQKEVSTTSMIYLQNSNLDVIPGDYIIDASGLLKTNIYNQSGVFQQGFNTNSLKTFEDNFSNQLLVKKPSLLPSHLTTSVYNGVKLTPNSSAGGTQNNINLFAGKYYYTSGSTAGSSYYISVPAVKVESVLAGGKVLFTNSSTIINMPKNTLLQIVRPTQIIGIDLEGDINAISETTSYAGQPVYAGAGAKLLVDEITDGRITNIKIIDQGANYIVTNKPLLFVNQYKANSNILIKS